MGENVDGHVSGTCGGRFQELMYQGSSPKQKGNWGILNLCFPMKKCVIYLLLTASILPVLQRAAANFLDVKK